MVKRHRNEGLTKRCSCPRGTWSKCPHTWFFNLKPPGGKNYRLSLDHQTGRRIDSKSEAVLVAAQLRAAILAGTFRPRGHEPQRLPTPGQPETLETYARHWLATTAAQNLKTSTVRPGRYLRRGDEPEPRIDPLNREDANALLTAAEEYSPDWCAFVLCGLRTGLRLGELLALQWGTSTGATRRFTSHATSFAAT